MKLLLLIIGIFGVSHATADSGLEELVGFINNLGSMQAEFTQTVFDDQLRQLEVSRGKFSLKKPGKFRWDYTVPFVQNIVSNGKKLWLFDPDLEQVTIKPFSEALGAAPIAFLTGDENIEDQFNVTELGKIDGREFVQLELKVKDTDYGLMLLALGDSGLEVMELKDKLGQVTRIEFTNSKTNLALNDSLFEFAIPAGADVIGE